MLNFIKYLLIGVALSMDAFSLSVILKTSNLLDKRKNIVLVLLIGLFHFVMPYFGSIISDIIPLNIEKIANYILAGIFFVLGVEILCEKDEKYTKVDYFTLILISLTVSIDSLTVGLGLNLLNEYNIFISLLFSLTSIFFTTIGLLLGKKINNHLGKNSKIISSILLLILAIIYLFR